MGENLKKYLADVCKYYGFALSLPMGQHFVNLIFKTGEANTESFIYSLLILLTGLTFLVFGGILYDKIN